MIERHYGHLLADSNERELERLDSAFGLCSSSTRSGGDGPLLMI